MKRRYFALMYFFIYYQAAKMRRFILLGIALLISSFAFTQVVYTFNGAGKWSDSANWMNRLVPPSVILAGDSIIINPSGLNECVLDVQELVKPGATFIVRSNKKFRIIGDLGSVSDSTFTDPRDGRVYKFKHIGTQVWMTQNLDADTYRNGDPIPEVTDGIQWGSLTTGARSYYDNDPAKGTIYGKLYNWYAIEDARGLAPAGWHFPNQDEWATLATLFGGEQIAGGSMKATYGWSSPNTGATNSSGFTGLPGGYRDGYSYTPDNSGDGLFYGIGEIGMWYGGTSLMYAAWIQDLFYDKTWINRGFLSRESGVSVRCIRD